MEKNEIVDPTYMTHPRAPDNVLKMIFYGRKKATCGSSCGCRKTGLFCASARTDCCLSCLPPYDEDGLIIDEEEEELCV